MDGLSPNPGEVAWADLDREWTEFWAGIESHAHEPAHWFTPAWASQLRQLLERGRQWRSEAEHTHTEEHLYACHLRRLEPVLHDVQRALTESAEHLLRQRDHIHTAREWARQQVAAGVPSAQTSGVLAAWQRRIAARPAAGKAPLPRGTTPR